MNCDMSSKVVFLGLAQSIYEASQGVADFLDDNGFEAPSFEEGGLEHYPKNPQFSNLRFKLIDAVSDLYHLALGPADMGFLQPLFVSLRFVQVQTSSDEVIFTVES